MAVGCGGAGEACYAESGDIAGERPRTAFKKNTKGTGENVFRHYIVESADCKGQTRLYNTFAAAGELKRDGRDVFCCRAVRLMMRHGIGVRVKNHNIAYALRLVERNADYQIFRLIALADNLNYGFGDERYFGIYLVRFAVKNRNIRPFLRTFREAQREVGDMNAGAGVAFLWRGTNGTLNTKNGALMQGRRRPFPYGNAADYFQFDADVMRRLR